MNSHFRVITLAVGVLCSSAGFAQTPAPAIVPAAKASAPTGSAARVNTKSGTYHCEGTKFYGKTKAGEYMPEADAKAKGFHADHKKACST